MHANLSPSVDLNFLDGYLFCLIQQIANDQGLDASGLGNYYGHRIKQRIGGLQEYEGSLARYLLGLKPKRVVHAGIGIGTLACALACNGTRVVGVESDLKRVACANLIRACVTEIWPDIHYDIVSGLFPDVLAGQNYDDSILLFTNIQAGWNEATLDSVISSMTNFREVYLDLRLFGLFRPDESDQVTLYDRIARSSRWAERLPHVSDGVARFVFAR